MGTVAFLALYALTSVTGTKQVELLGLNLKGRNVTAVGMSPNGDFLLASASLSTGLSALVVRQDQIQTWPVRGFDSPALVAIDDQGTILGSYQIGVRTGIMTRAFLLRQGTFSLAPILREPDRTPVGFIPRGLGKNGEIFGNLYGEIKSHEIVGPGVMGAAIMWLDNEPRLLAPESVVIHHIGAVAATGIGILGYVPRHPPTRGQSMGIGHVPAFFRPSGTEVLRLPTDASSVLPVASTSDGSVVIGNGNSTSGRTMGIVWKDGVPEIPTIADLKRWNTAFHGLTPDGKMAVGSISMAGKSTAVLWDREKGLRRLADVAAERKYTLPVGWEMIDAVGISPDGKRVFGTATNEKGLRRPYLLWLTDRDVGSRKEVGSGDRT